MTFDQIRAAYGFVLMIVAAGTLAAAMILSAVMMGQWITDKIRRRWK